MDIIVYSANIGNYDYFSSPEIFDPNIRYILFTDNKYIKSNVWEISHTNFIDETIDNRKIARFLKTNPHSVLPSHNISIWIDYCFKPKFNNTIDVLKAINFENNEIMSYKHSERNCTYDESEIIKERLLDYPEIVDRQMDIYNKDGFPKNYGLFETGFIVRKNNESVNTFNEFWWNQIKEFSGRDQLSQMYSLWKTGVIVNKIEIGQSTYSNPFLYPKISHSKKWEK